VAQLAGRPAEVGTTTATAVAALAVEHVLTHLAGKPTLIDSAVELDLAGGTFIRLDRPAHPACGCAPRPEGVRPGRAAAAAAGDNRGRVVR
jgi:hypothetical protein